MEKRMMVCLAAVLVAFTGTGVVHGWPWSKKAQDNENVPQQHHNTQFGAEQISIELSNKTGKTYYYAYAYDESALHKAHAETLNNGGTARFSVNTQYPPFLWVGANWNGSGLVYIIDPSKYKYLDPEVKLKIQTGGSLIDLEHPNTRIQDKGYKGGLVYGGSFTK